MKSIAILLTTLALAGCGSKSSGGGDDDGDGTGTGTGGESQVLTPKSDADGVVVATIDPNATTAQTVKSSDSSPIKGASATFPPGSMTVATDITLEAGFPVANAAAASDLGLAGATLAEASATVVIDSSAGGEAAAPFTLAIQLSSGASLLGENDNLVVIYKVKKADGTLALGVIPTGSLTTEGTTVKFSAKAFGAYQAARSSVAVAAAKEVTTTTAVTTLADLAPYIGTWKPNCFNGNDGQSNTSDLVWLYIDANGMREELMVFDNPTCSGDPARTEISRMTYSIGADSSCVSGAKDADVTSLGGTLVVQSDAKVAEFNAMKYCGFSDWVKGTAKDISNKECDGEVRLPIARVFYTVIKIDGDKLIFGDGEDPEYDMSTVAKRSRTLDTEYRTKQ